MNFSYQKKSLVIPGGFLIFVSIGKVLMNNTLRPVANLNTVIDIYTCTRADSVLHVTIFVNTVHVCITRVILLYKVNISFGNDLLTISQSKHLLRFCLSTAPYDWFPLRMFIFLINTTVSLQTIRYEKCLDHSVNF